MSNTGACLDFDVSTHTCLQLIPSNSSLWVKWTELYKPLLAQHLFNSYDDPIVVRLYDINPICHTQERILNALEALVMFTPHSMQEVRLKQLELLTGEVSGSCMGIDIKELVLMVSLIRVGCELAWNDPGEEKNQMVNNEGLLKIGKELKKVLGDIIYGTDQRQAKRERETRGDTTGEGLFPAYEASLGLVSNRMAVQSLPNLLVSSSDVVNSRPKTADGLVIPLSRVPSDSYAANLSTYSFLAQDYKYVPKEMRVLGMGMASSQQELDLYVSNLRKISKLRRLFSRIKALGKSASQMGKRGRFRSESMVHLTTLSSDTTDPQVPFRDVNLSTAGSGVSYSSLSIPHPEALASAGAPISAANLRPTNFWQHSTSNQGLTYNQLIRNQSQTHAQFWVIPRSVVNPPDPFGLSNSQHLQRYYDLHPFWLFMRLLLGPSIAQAVWLYVSGEENGGDGVKHSRVDGMENFVCFKEFGHIKVDFRRGEKIIFDGIASTDLKGANNAPMLFRLLVSRPGEKVSNRFLVAYNAHGEDQKRLIKAIKLSGDTGPFTAIYAERPGTKSPLPNMRLLSVMTNVGLVAKSLHNSDAEALEKERKEKLKALSLTPKLERSLEKMNESKLKRMRSWWEALRGGHQVLVHNEVPCVNHLGVNRSSEQPNTRHSTSTSSEAMSQCQRPAIATFAGMNTEHLPVGHDAAGRPESYSYGPPANFDHDRYIWYHPEIKPLDLGELRGRLEAAVIEKLFREEVDEENSA